MGGVKKIKRTCLSNETGSSFSTCKMADGAVSNCVGDGDKQQSNADIENLTQYVS